ncbi:transglycosylase domain-containing protein [Nocardiopsis kunsanensis]|uniref:transglycosylase domain-containing protein n=1 Tax=Nocardiopsis kunsanensis TaxID=141693 RepID=UPI00037A6AA0|nr:transglycosylase domain-containing protein [Nocardiopsis kunsanensis]
MEESGDKRTLRERVDTETNRKILRLAGLGALAGVLSAALLMPWVGGLGLAGRDTAASFMDIPHDLKVPRLAEHVVLTDTDGEPFAEVAQREREVVDLDEISPWVPAALMAIEDDRFYEHSGLDLRGLLRAALRTAQGNTQGGSTITQQYVKNLLMEQAETEEELERASGRNITRKIVELRQAIELEERLTKDEIMQGYLNLAYFGAGAHGIEVAAQRYFSVPASELDPGQAATIVGIVRSPSYYDPLQNPEHSQDRRDVVLDRMVDTGYIEAEEADQYRGDLRLDHTPRGGSCAESEYPHYCQYVMDWLLTSDVLGETEEERTELIGKGGMTVETGLNRRAQEAAQEAVDRHVPPEDSTKFAAQAVVHPGTGQIRALAQNLRYGFEDESAGTTSINLAVDQDEGGSTGFQAGSTFKPYTLAAALDQGLGYGTSFDSPKSVSVSGLVNCDGEKMSSWSVSNAGESDGGEHNMLSGTKGSVNTYFAQLQRRVGLCETSQMAKRLGVHRADGQDLGVWSSFTLGDQEVSPMSVANSYAVFASGGSLCEPVPAREITIGEPDNGGERIQVDSECEQVIEPDVADGVNHLLQKPFEGGTADGLDIGAPVAGKTGTTDNSAYAWFAGYTPHLSSAVVVGDVRGGEQYPLRNVTIGGRSFGVVYGSTLPGPIWQETMREAVEDTPQDGFGSPPSKFGDPSSEPSGSDEDDDDDGGSPEGG